MLPDLYYGIAAYNEGENILSCLESLSSQDIDARIETLICANGCTDKTEENVIEGMQRYPKLNIKILNSRRGKSCAQTKIVQSIKNRDVPLVFVDADIIADRKCVKILYDELKDIDKLIIVGTWPLPLKTEKLSPWEKFLNRVLHVRAFYPESELAVNDVSEYKSYVDRKPQIKVSSEFEKHSKIYFHGRTFILRNANFFHLPDDENFADDTFIPNFIHTKYGPGTIRTRYDAIVFYKPYTSLRSHFNTYRRVFRDLDKIDDIKDFRESRKMERTKLDWNFITSKGLPTTLDFLTYSLIAKGEKLLYKVLPKKDVSEIWKYDSK